jgi:DNA-binding MarR family transcriptional regulator
MTATELSKLLILDKATLSGVLDRMVETGWIVKSPDPEDRRVQRIYPSEEANRLKPELIEKRKEANQEILEMFSPEERVLFKRFLRDMI